MAAITDLLTNVGQAGTLTSLQAPGKAIGATSITIGSGTNWPTTTAVYFAIRTFSATLITTANPGGIVPNTYTEWKGVLVGTTISNLTLQYGTDQIYTAGTNTQVFIPVTSSRENAIVSWGTVHADQLGNLLPAAVQTAIGTGGITATNLAGSIPYAKLLSTIFSGQIQTYTNAGTGGGVIYYINLGGIKLAWNNGGGSSGLATKATATAYVFNFPPGFFTSITAATATPTNMVTFGEQYSSIGGVNTTSMAINVVSPGGNASSGMSFFVIGT